MIGGVRPLSLVAASLLLVLSGRAEACTEDPALGRAAELLVDRPEPWGPTALLEAAREAGSDAPVVDALIIRDGNVGRRDRFLARVAARRHAPLDCGEARRENRWLVLVAPRAGRIELLERGRLRITLAEGWRSPRIVARDARGDIWQASVSGELTLPEVLERPVVVQLVAEGPSGPRPVAERRIGQGLALVVPDSDEPLDRRLATLRERSGLGALRENRLIARVASAHARAVCEAGQVAHIIDERDPRQRLVRAGLRARHVGEVIARAEDPSRAYAALLASPSHRAALTDRRFTDVGIGLAESAGQSCVVVLLAAWPRAVPPD